MIEIESSAAEQLVTMLEPGQALHVGVRGGGCSGFEYQLTIGSSAEQAVTISDIPVVIAPEAGPYLEGSHLTWEPGEGINPGGFRFQNPNHASCGCGKSFSC